MITNALVGAALAVLAMTAAGQQTAAPPTPKTAAPAVTATTYDGRKAFRLTNGKTEAVVVPGLSGRVMRYGFVGGPNRLWNAPKGKIFKSDEWHNWGGDKTWPAPQSTWPMYAPTGGWPPHPTYDGLPHEAETLPGGRLRTTGPVMAGWGVRCVRDYGFESATGEFVVTTTFRKEAGDQARQLAAWHVTQIPPPDAAFVPLNPRSTYKNNFHWFGGARPKEAKAVAVSPSLLKFVPTTGFYKLGADAPVSVMAAVQDGVALVLRAAKLAGQYPEGAEGSGFPVTVWNQGEKDVPARYVELEIMSPLTLLKRGDTLTHTVRWSLHRLPGRDVNAPAVRAAVERLLRAPAPQATKKE